MPAPMGMSVREKPARALLVSPPAPGPPAQIWLRESNGCPPALASLDKTQRAVSTPDFPSQSICCSASAFMASRVSIFMEKAKEKARPISTAMAIITTIKAMPLFFRECGEQARFMSMGRYC